MPSPGMGKEDGTPPGLARQASAILHVLPPPPCCFPFLPHLCCRRERSIRIKQIHQKYITGFCTGSLSLTRSRR